MHHEQYHMWSLYKHKFIICLGCNIEVIAIVKCSGTGNGRDNIRRTVIEAQITII